MTTVLWIIAAIVIVNILLVTFWYFFRDKEEKPSVEPVEKPSEPIQEPEPTTEPDEPEKPVEQKFNVGDWVVYNGVLSDHKDHLLQIKTIDSNRNRYEFTDGSTFSDMCLRRWTIQDAKDGDMLACESGWTCIFKTLVNDETFSSYCFMDNTKWFCETGSESHTLNKTFMKAYNGNIHPATKEQRDLLFLKMAEAGYTWDAETKTLSKIKPEPAPEPEPQPIEEQNSYDEFAKDFKELVDYFSPVVKIGDKVNSYLYDRCLALHEMFPDLLQKQNFPVPVDYWTDDVSKCCIQKAEAWLFFMVLSELVPEKRNELCRMAYDYIESGKDVSIFGWSFESDPNIWRMIAACVYSVTRDTDMIPELRKELGGKELTYKKDISECYIDICGFMPKSPAPFIKGYERSSVTYEEDMNTHNYVSDYYSLDSKDKDIRQATIQAISNKEAKSAHLFGAPRTVTDSKYGTMSFLPVFGKHNLGIEIPTDGAIAKFCEAVGKPSSSNRNSLLTQEYGRRRPGMGDTDASANPDPKQRMLVNYAIEEGDGHTTGYYNQNGDYVDGNGNHIGDYVTYYQTYNYANSYPSGHSAYIMGYALALMEVIPDKADVILRAANGFAISRCITRYHWMSDTIQGRVIGTMMLPILHATTNVKLDDLLKAAKKEYEALISGDVTPEPTPEPTEKVNTSLAYAIGGYGSCHVDAGEKEMVHRCTKQCTKERHPAIQVNQRVEFTIEGGGVTDDNGKRTGVWEANTPYGIKCPAVKEDVIATITMRNENGVKVLEYRCSKDGTHDDGAGEI